MWLNLMNLSSAANPLIEINNLSIDFNVQHGKVSALRNVSFTIPRGKTVALVGESGSGKSVTAQAVLGILPNNGVITGGSIKYYQDSDQTVDIAQLKPKSQAMRRLRGNHISIIFQEPMVSLSPVHTLADQIGEALKLHTQTTTRQIRGKVAEMLEKVGFPDPKRALSQYPFELSGGLRQRAMIAMALICQPSLLIADEPTGNLDVETAAGVFDMMMELNHRVGTALVMVTHDNSLAERMDRVLRLDHGTIVES